MVAADPAAVVRVEIRLWRTARLTGRVTVEGDRPAPEVTVRAIPNLVYQSGGQLSGATAVTDSDGIYDLPELVPDEYVLAILSTYTTMTGAEAAQAAPDGVGRRTSLKMRVGAAWLRYPTSSFASAWLQDGVLFVRPAVVVPFADGGGSALSLGAGDDRRVDLFWRAEPSTAVGGVVTTSDGDVGDVEIRASRLSDSAARAPRLFDHARTRAEPDGRFRMVGLAPGTYRLFAARLEAGHRRAWATAVVDVGADGPGDVPLLLRPGLTVRGKVVSAVEDRPIPERLLANLSLSLTPAGGPSSFQPGAESRIAASGEFQLGPVLPGRYTLDVPMPLPKPWTLQASTLGTVTVDGDLLELQAHDISGVTIVLTDTPSSLTVALGEGRKQADVSALLFDAGRQRWETAWSDARRFRECSIAPGGECRYEQVPPGTYFVAAIPAEKMVWRWRTAEFLEFAAKAASRVVVDPGESLTVRIGGRD
jgi:hypothetical protein